MAQQTALMKAGAWEQGSVVEKSGWATMPGMEKRPSAYHAPMRR